MEGIVVDATTKQRIATVRITNTTSKRLIFNNSRGEFQLFATPGDTLIAEREGFHSDTLVYIDQKVLIFSLKRSVIYIPEVKISARKSPEELYKQAQEDYKRAFGLAKPGSAFSVGPTGAGLNINTIYNLLSKEAKNARRLTKLLEAEYQQNVIDSKYTPDLVRNYTGLSGDELKRFMQEYRPSYYFIIASDEYELMEYIKNKYKLFKLNPNLRHLPELPKINIDVSK